MDNGYSENMQMGFKQPQRHIKQAAEDENYKNVKLNMLNLTLNEHEQT